MSNTLQLSPICLAILALLNPAHAEDQSTDQTMLPEVRISSQRTLADDYAPATTQTGLKINAALRDVPQTVNVVTAELMRDQAAHTLQDVMKNIPGVGLAAGDGQRDAFVIRGFNALFDNLLDGVRDDPQYFRDLYNIERIEVVKGPAAVLYGRGSSGGLVNRVTRKPGYTPSAEIGVTVGSYGQRRTEFGLNQPLGDTLAMRLDGAVEDSDSFRDNGYAKTKALAPSLAWRSGAHSVLLQFDYQNQQRSIDFGVPALKGEPADVPRSQYYGALHADANDYSNTIVRQGTAQYKYQVAEHTTVSNTLRYYTYVLDRNNTRIASVNDLLAVPTVTLNRANVYRDEDGWFNQTEISHDLRLGGIRHQLLAGLEVGRQSRFVDSRNSAAPNTFTTTLFNPVLKDLPFAVTNTALTRGDAVQTTRGAYVQSLSSWTPTIKTLLGLRYDSFGQEFTDTRTAKSNFLERTDHTVSPRGGVVWQPSGMQSYYASLSRSYQPSGEAAPLTADNSQLGPEKTANIEVGSKLELFGGKASLTAALYQLTRTNIKVSDPANSGVLIPVGEQRARGMELSLAGEVAAGLQAVAGYSYMQTEVTKSFGTIKSPYSSAAATPLLGKQLALSPRHVFSLWLLRSLDGVTPGLQAGAGMNYRSASFATLTNAVSMPGYATYDAAVYFRPARKGYSVALNLKNAFDRRYYIAANNDVGINPGAPRSVELSLRYAF